jgi:hypothetical protein
MTRDEARKALEGTWSFTLNGNSIMIREESLLREISQLSQAARPATISRNQHRPIRPVSAFYLAPG